MNRFAKSFIVGIGFKYCLTVLVFTIIYPTVGLMDLKTHLDKKKYIFLPIIFKLKTNVDETEKDTFFFKNTSHAFLSS